MKCTPCNSMLSLCGAQPSQHCMSSQCKQQSQNERTGKLHRLHRTTIEPCWLAGKTATSAPIRWRLATSMASRRQQLHAHHGAALPTGRCVLSVAACFCAGCCNIQYYECRGTVAVGAPCLASHRSAAVIHGLHLQSLQLMIASTVWLAGPSRCCQECLYKAMPSALSCWPASGKIILKACDVQHVLICRTSAYWMAIRKVPFICSPYMFLSNGGVALVGSCADILLLLLLLLLSGCRSQRCVRWRLGVV